VVAGNPAYRHSIVEVKETAASFLFMCVALEQAYPLWKRTCGETGGDCRLSAEGSPVSQSN